MTNAAGILFLTQDDRALFLRRSPTAPDCAGCWDFPGGAAEDDETALQTVERECKEEIGVLPKGERVYLTRSQAFPAAGGGEPAGPSLVPLDDGPAGVDFTTFLQRVEEEFVPKLNDEHDAYVWAPVASPPGPIHPGCQIAISRLTMDELGVARAIAAGALTSPQKYENVWLFDIRITGTGVAYRNKLDEFAYKPPEVYLNQEFLDRCNGLTVIWKHPDKATLDSKEFGDRVIGSVFVPYIGDGIRHPAEDVWAVVKVYDEDAAQWMIENQMSTSPCVVFRPGSTDNEKLKLENGSTLLIEGKPSLLDHIAICEVGVWDKGNPPTGVSRGEVIMADETARADAEEEKKVADAEAVTVDKLLKCVDDLNNRMDAYDEDEKKRKDAEVESKGFEEKSDKKKDDDEEDKEEKKADKKRKDEFPEDMKKKDAKRKDAKEEDDEEEEKKADARADSVSIDLVKKLEKQIADLQSKLPKPLTDDDYHTMAATQAKADAVFSAFGGGKRASRPMDGETPMAYRRRLIGDLKSHSSRWKDIDLNAIADSALDVVEADVYADAMVIARNPPDLGDGELREHVRSSGGHTITEFHGKPRAWMDQFGGGRRAVVGIRTQSR